MTLNKTIQRGFLFLSLICSLSACQNKQTEQNNQEQEEETSFSDFDQIKAQGEITAITLYSSVSYFQYKMQPMGYEYEMMQDFADSHGLKLNIKVAENPNKLTEMLLNGEGDVIMYNIPVTNQLKNKVIYCGREIVTSQVLVQRNERKDTLLKDVTELIGKEVYVKHDTKHHERLKNLNSELGGGIIIKDIEKDTITTEDLIEMVSLGQIKYTVSDDLIAKLNKTYYKNIDVDLKVSFPQRSSWAVSKNSPALADSINSWFEKNKNTTRYKAIVKRYFELSKLPDDYEVLPILNGMISPFDKYFKKYASNLGWEWQLIASIGYQESRFKPQAASWAGAEGVMGIMPRTAKGIGMSRQDVLNPETSIKGGVEILRRFRNGFSEITDPEEIIKFTLAAYNAGIGHVYDAQRLAEKYGKNPNVWDDNVEEFIKLKSDPKYYNDPVCKHGYLRGTETYKYVREVVDRYKYYKTKSS